MKHVVESDRDNMFFVVQKKTLSDNFDRSVKIEI